MLVTSAFARWARTLGMRILPAMLSTSCAEGNRPFALVVVCLKDQQDVSEFLHELREEAERSGMTFTDGSERTARDLAPLNQRQPGESVLNVWPDRRRPYAPVIRWQWDLATTSPQDTQRKLMHGLAPLSIAWKSGGASKRSQTHRNAAPLRCLIVLPLRRNVRYRREADVRLRRSDYGRVWL